MSHDGAAARGSVAASRREKGEERREECDSDRADGGRGAKRAALGRGGGGRAWLLASVLVLASCGVQSLGADDSSKGACMSGGKCQAPGAASARHLLASSPPAPPAADDTLLTPCGGNCYNNGICNTSLTPARCECDEVLYESTRSH
jgi:hypothetical protein